VAFFVLAYALAWLGWPFYAAGVLFPEPIFFAIGPLLAALIVIGVAEGRSGFRDLGARMIRWRVPWYWYVVAVGLPLAVRFVGVGLNIGLGEADALAFSELAWTSFAAAFAVRLINPMDGALGEEPGWRGFAVPRMQASWSPLFAAVALGLLVAGWHLPLVVMGNRALAPVGLLSTFAITIVYCWLFNHARGSVLLTLIFHAMQGSITFGELGLHGADLTRQEWLECALWFVVAIGVIMFDRKAWHAAPPPAVFPEPGPQAQQRLDRDATDVSTISVRS
jgi:membrane protease YdiL (CAAX protease family)